MYKNQGFCLQDLKGFARIIRCSGSSETGSRLYGPNYGGVIPVMIGYARYEKPYESAGYPPPISAVCRCSR